MGAVEAKQLSDSSTASSGGRTAGVKERAKREDFLSYTRIARFIMLILQGEGSNRNNTDGIVELLFHGGKDVDKDTTIISSRKDEDNDGQKGTERSKHLESIAEPHCLLSTENETCQSESSSHVKHRPTRKKRNKNIAEKPKDNLLQKVEQNDDKTDKEKDIAAACESDEIIECRCNTISEGQKLGKSCKCHLDNKEVTTVHLNFLDLPLRPGKEECPYYMLTGSCEYALNCQYHHPDPTASTGQDSLSQCQNGQYSQTYVSRLSSVPVTQWPMQMIPTKPTSSVDAWATEWLLLNQEFCNYQGLHCPVYPMSQPKISVQTPSAVSMNQKKNKPGAKKGHLIKYPQRPGQPDCQPFMKNGVCKNKSACKFHHPRTRLSTKKVGSLHSSSLLLKTEQRPCTHFRNHGSCKHGSSCLLQHKVCSSSSTTVSDKVSKKGNEQIMKWKPKLAYKAVGILSKVNKERPLPKI